MCGVQYKQVINNTTNIAWRKLFIIFCWKVNKHFEIHFHSQWSRRRQCANCYPAFKDK